MGVARADEKEIDSGTFHSEVDVFGVAAEVDHGTSPFLGIAVTCT